MTGASSLVKVCEIAYETDWQVRLESDSGRPVYTMSFTISRYTEFNDARAAFGYSCTYVTDS